MPPSRRGAFGNDPDEGGLKQPTPETDEALDLVLSGMIQMKED